jgi:hypothetical protein
MSLFHIRETTVYQEEPGRSILNGLFAVNMFGGFADISATDLQLRCALPEVHFGIPIIDDRIPRGPLVQPKLYLVIGPAQSYKTTLAVQMLSPFLSSHFPSSQAIWIDGDLKFPIDLLRSRDFVLDKLSVASCRSSEEILFNLLDIEHQLSHGTCFGGLRAVVIDVVNASFWVDESARRFVKKPIRWVLRDVIEKLVRAHGINVIVVMQDLGDFEMWRELDSALTVKLRSHIISAGNGVLECQGFQHRFVVTSERTIEWGKRSLGSEPGIGPGFGEEGEVET